MATIAVTIGTDDAWAPPKFVRFELGDDLFITNAERFSWRAEADLTITRCAIYYPRGWGLVQIPTFEFRRRALMEFDAGALRIELLPNPVDVDWPQAQLAGRRWLKGRHPALLAP